MFLTIRHNVLVQKLPFEVHLTEIRVSPYTVEGALKQQVSVNIKLKKEIGSYQGLRHTKGLPVRGQRTKTNSRTVRGNVRKTMGSGRRKVEKT